MGVKGPIMEFTVLIDLRKSLKKAKSKEKEKKKINVKQLDFNTVLYCTVLYSDNFMLKTKIYPC